MNEDWEMTSPRRQSAAHCSGQIIERHKHHARVGNALGVQVAPSNIPRCASHASSVDVALQDDHSGRARERIADLQSRESAVVASKVVSAWETVAAHRPQGTKVTRPWSSGSYARQAKLMDSDMGVVLPQRKTLIQIAGRTRKNLLQDAAGNASRSARDVRYKILQCSVARDCTRSPIVSTKKTGQRGASISSPLSQQVS